MKKWFFFFSLILFSCNHDFSFYSDKKETGIYNRIKTSNFSKNTAEFNNKKVEMRGVFYMDFEHIYLIAENKKVYLDFAFCNLKDKNENELDGEKLLSFNGKQIVVKGKYIHGTTGHLGCCEANLLKLLTLETEN